MLESARENRVTSQTVYDMLDEFQENFGENEPQKQKEILLSIIESVEINPDADVKKGDTVVSHVKFKCPVSFYRTLPDDMQKLLGITEFTRLETTEYTIEKNSLDCESIVQTVVMFSHK